MQEYAIVSYPQIDIAKIQVFRQKYDPMSTIIPPHITLVFPFAGISEDQIVKHISEVTQILKAFPIHLAGFEKSFDEYFFLLIKEGKEQIEKVRELLYSGILRPFIQTNIPFTPHITLGYFGGQEGVLDEKAFSVALREAEALQLDFHCMFDSITLIQGDGITPAKTIQSFHI